MLDLSAEDAKGEHVLTSFRVGMTCGIDVMLVNKFLAHIFHGV